VTGRRPTVVIIDYGSGNLRSAERALAHVGADVLVSADLEPAQEADGVVLPGVGAYAACMDGIIAVGADRLVRSRVAAGRPVLGICVGMQVLYGVGDEHGVRTPGIGVLAGEVGRLDAPLLPHIGWNTITPPQGSTLFAGLETERFYFVHSYAVRPDDSGSNDVETVAVHGERFVAAVENGAVSATQFHPEKSGEAGLSLLHNWVAGLSGR
jgi:glutamine amidotransferase